MIFQAIDTGRSWPDVVNTFLLIIGPILIIVANKLTANKVQGRLDVAADKSNRKLNHIVLLTNSTLTAAQKHNALLIAQLEGAGLVPANAPPLNTVLLGLLDTDADEDEKKV